MNCKQRSESAATTTTRCAGNAVYDLCGNGEYRNSSSLGLLVCVCVCVCVCVFTDRVTQELQIGSAGASLRRSQINSRCCANSKCQPQLSIAPSFLSRLPDVSVYSASVTGRRWCVTNSVHTRSAASLITKSHRLSHCRTVCFFGRPNT